MSATSSLLAFYLGSWGNTLIGYLIIIGILHIFIQFKNAEQRILISACLTLLYKAYQFRALSSWLNFAGYIIVFPPIVAFWAWIHYKGKWPFTMFPGLTGKVPTLPNRLLSKEKKRKESENSKFPSDPAIEKLRLQFAEGQITHEEYKYRMAVLTQNKEQA